MARYRTGEEVRIGDTARCIEKGMHFIGVGCQDVVVSIQHPYIRLKSTNTVLYPPSVFELVSRATAPEQEQPMGEPLVDLINHPPHYAGLSPEPVDVIEAWQLEWHEGNAMKYIARAKSKGERIQDLRKAAWYLTRKADLLESPTIPAT